MVITHDIKCFIITNQTCTSFLTSGVECEYARTDKISLAMKFPARDIADAMVADVTNVNKNTDLRIVHPMMVTYKIDMETL